MIIQNEPVSADQKADLSFTVDPGDLRAATEALNGLEICERLETDERIGKVSIVGAGMRSHPGVAAKVFETLGENGINIEMISTSPIKISCVIAAGEVPGGGQGAAPGVRAGRGRRPSRGADRGGAPAGRPARRRAGTSDEARDGA